MAKRTKKAVEPEEKRSHTVVAKLIPLYGIEFHDNQMRAFLAFGRTPELAAQNARNAIQRHLPRNRWDIDIELVNPELFEKAGVNLEPDPV